MSITDELREYTEKQVKWLDVSKVHYRKLFSIADRIDAEHERLMQEQPFTIDMVPMTDESMAEHGWVRLPKDADGEYIHVGERVQLIGNDPGTVSHMSLADDGWRVYVKYDGGIGTGSGEPKHIRHYHAPTVEGVLREMHAELDEVTALYVGEVIDSDERDRDEARIFAEYAAKLKLTEGDA